MIVTENFQNTMAAMLLENSIDGFFAFDAKLNITEWSQSMEAYTGIQRVHCLGRNVEETLTSFHETGESPNFQKVLRGQRVVSKNNPYYFKESKRRGYFDCHYFPIENEMGVTEGAMVIFRDKTERFELDESLISLATRVEQSIKSKTEGLSKANQVLRAKLRERRKFGYDVLLKNIEITDSIVYAKQIQQVILPSIEEMKTSFPDLFVLFKPRDIVSGDFYWHIRKSDIDYIAAVDCTGHGVPGALISILGYNALNDAILQKNLSRPSEILDYLNKTLSEVFDKGQTSTVRDGMDISLCRVDRGVMKMEYAGAFNPLYMMRGGAFRKIKGNRQPIGNVGFSQKEFTNHEIDIKEGDCFYIFSDGYMDQFGGPENKKFKQPRFINTLLNNHDQTMEDQGIILERIFEEWKSQNYQVDDVLVIGFSI